MSGSEITIKLSEHQCTGLDFLVAQEANREFTTIHNKKDIIDYIIERVANGSKNSNKIDRKIVELLGLLDPDD